MSQEAFVQDMILGFVVTMLMRLDILRFGRSGKRGQIGMSRRGENRGMGL